MYSHLCRAMSLKKIWIRRAHTSHLSAFRIITMETKYTIERFKKVHNVDHNHVITMFYFFQEQNRKELTKEKQNSSM